MKRFVDLLKEGPILMRMICPEAFNGKCPKKIVIKWPDYYDEEMQKDIRAEAYESM